MDSAQTAWQKDEEFWYEDGTIILIAREIEFRVYKGLLAERSPVFKDMFSIPQPEDSEMYDGCPEMVLYDAPEAVETLLEHMYSAGDRSVTSTSHAYRSSHTHTHICA